MQRSRPSLKHTATLTASSSNFNPHEAMGSANSQSPLCWQKAAKNDARWCAEARLASTLALDSSTPGRYQIGCLVGSYRPCLEHHLANLAVQSAKQDCRKLLLEWAHSVRMSSWRDNINVQLLLLLLLGPYHVVQTLRIIHKAGSRYRIVKPTN